MCQIYYIVINLLTPAYTNSWIPGSEFIWPLAFIFKHETRIPKTPSLVKPLTLEMPFKPISSHAPSAATLDYLGRTTAATTIRHCSGCTLPNNHLIVSRDKPNNRPIVWRATGVPLPTFSLIQAFSQTKSNKTTT